VRLLIAGQGWIAVRTARLLAGLHSVLGQDVRLEVIRNAGDKGIDTWMPSLARLACGAGWPVHRCAEAAGLSRGDILLSLQHDRIIDCAALGGAAAYNLHFARLPEYRGSLTSAIATRQGAAVAGVTLHVLEPAVDAGPVIAIREFALPAFCTAYDLYCLYHRHGFDLLTSKLDALLTGQVTAVPQDDAAATTFYRTAIDFSDIELSDFARPADQIRDWVRSLIFPPRQYPTFMRREIASCYTLKLALPQAWPPGTVIHQSAALAIVSCQQDLLCLELRSENG
jgi:methionyl-tRNA formyltransferase